MARPSNGAFAALALAGLAYFFKNRKQMTGMFQQLGGRLQNQLPGTTSQNQVQISEPRAQTGETIRM